MPSVASKTDIYRMALDLLQETSESVSPGDGKAVSDFLDRNYPTARDSELRAHPWNFAVTRIELPKDATKPAWEWDNQYTMPSDLLRVIQLTVNGLKNSAPVDYEVEGNKILTNATSPLRLRYIRRVTEEGDYDPLFVEALVAKLAFKMAHWLTGKTSFAERALNLYTDTLSVARRADAIEVLNRFVYAEDVIKVRE